MPFRQRDAYRPKDTCPLYAEVLEARELLTITTYELYALDLINSMRSNPTQFGMDLKRLYNNEPGFIASHGVESRDPVWTDLRRIINYFEGRTFPIDENNDGRPESHEIWRSGFVGSYSDTFLSTIYALPSSGPLVMSTNSSDFPVDLDATSEQHIQWMRQNGYGHSNLDWSNVPGAKENIGQQNSLTATAAAYGQNTYGYLKRQAYVDTLGYIIDWANPRFGHLKNLAGPTQSSNLMLSANKSIGPSNLIGIAIDHDFSTHHIIHDPSHSYFQMSVYLDHNRNSFFDPNELVHGQFHWGSETIYDGGLGWSEGGITFHGQGLLGIDLVPNVSYRVQFTSDDGTIVRSRTIKLSQGQTYVATFQVVPGFGLTHDTSYSLVSDPFEPNNQLDDASNIGNLRSTPKQHFTLRGTSDEDWLRFSVTDSPGVGSQIELEADGGLDLQAELYRLEQGRLTLLRSSDGSAIRKRLDLTGLTLDDYFVRIFSPTGAEGFYTLETEISNTAPDIQIQGPTGIAGISERPKLAWSVNDENGVSQVSAVLRKDGLIVGVYPDFQKTVELSPFGIGEFSLDILAVDRGGLSYGPASASRTHTLLVTIAPPSAWGSEYQVHTTMAGFQGNSTSAMYADGSYVIAWESQDPQGLSTILGQFFEANGTRRGAEFLISSDAVRTRLAATPDGGFVIVWDTAVLNGLSDIYARRFDHLGVPLSDPIPVALESGDQIAPKVAVDGAGNFVVTWDDRANSTVRARQYDAQGNPLGDSFLVSGQPFWLANPDIAMDPAGNFVIVWNNDQLDGSGWGVYGQRFNAAGIPVGLEFRANTTTLGYQSRAQLAMDAVGNFVVGWEGATQDPDGSIGLFAQRYSADGTPLGEEFQVNTYTPGTQDGFGIAMDADGDFVIAWDEYGQAVGSSPDIWAQRFSAAGVPQGGAFQVNTHTPGIQYTRSVSMHPDGDFLVTWMSEGQDGDGWGAYAQRFAPAPPLVTSISTTDSLRLLTPGKRLVHSLTELRVVFSEGMSAHGGTTGAHSVTNPANWHLTRNGIDVSELISNVQLVTISDAVTLTFASPLEGGDFVLTLRDTLQDYAGNPLDGDANGVAGGDFSLAFSIDPPSAWGSEFQVHTTTAGFQGNGTSAMYADGSYVIAWESQDPQGVSTILGQFFEANGRRRGAEFLISSDAVRTRLAATPDGGFVIVWDTAVYGPSDIYARRFDQLGMPLSDPIPVALESGDQFAPKVGVDGAGNFVVTWDDRANGTVRARRYDAQGNPLGDSFLVSGQPFWLANPDIAMDPAGNFVIVWNNNQLDGSGWGVYGQRFDAAGIPVGLEFRANTTTLGYQSGAQLAMDAVGNFVVGWEGATQDPDGSIGLFAQRYSADGTPLGGEFQVNTYTPGTQDGFRIAMDADGDFVIAWDEYGQAVGSPPDIWAQRFSVAGVPQGGAFQVNTHTPGIQYTNSVNMHPDGDFLVTWMSEGQDGDGWGAYAQSYRSAQTIIPDPAQIVDRHIFYNNSKFDSNTPGISVSDDSAIAPDRTPYFAGSGIAPLSSITSYSKGINGIMVDIADAAGTLTLSDFTFRVGSNNSLGTWTDAPAPQAFTVRPGAGVGGSDRVVIVWADGAIKNTWLQAIVEGNDEAGGMNTNTGLTASDVFFFGNKVGDTQISSPATVVVTSAGDELSARNNPGVNVGITNFYDFDKNNLVTAGDQLAARNNAGLLTRISIAAPLAGPLAAGDGSEAAVASTLATSKSTDMQGAVARTGQRLKTFELKAAAIAKAFSQVPDDGQARVKAVKLIERIGEATGIEDAFVDMLLERLGLDYEALTKLNPLAGRN